MLTLRLDELTEPTISEKDAENRILYKKWERELKRYDEALKQRRTNNDQIYNVILGQCTPAMRERLDGDSQFSSIDRTTDIIALLKLIQTHTGAKHGNQDPSHILMNAYTDFFNYKQGSMSVTDYHTGFKDRVDVLERLQGPLGQDTARVDQYALEMEVDKDIAKEACRQQFLATNFLFRSNHRVYGAMLDEMQNHRVRSGIEYPQTLTDALATLTTYIQPRRAHRQHNDTGGVAFLQDSSEQPREATGRMNDTQGRGGRGRGRGSNRGRGAGRGRGPAREHEEQTHNEAPEQSTSSNNDSELFDAYQECTLVDLRHAESSFLQRGITNQNNRWLIMDSGSTVDMVCDASLLTNITRASTPLRVRCNAGITTVHQTGKLGTYPNRVWYNPNGIANILGLRNITKHFRVTYDSTEEDAFLVHHPGGNISKFTAADNGLYLLNPGDAKNTIWNLMTTTVQGQQGLYTQRQNGQAQLARRVQTIMMRPSINDYQRAIDHNILRNCPVERRHIQAAEYIYGPDVGALKGKTPRKTVQHVPVDHNPVPPDILQAHRDIVLAMDIMFINKLPFLVTISRAIKFGTVELLPNRQVATIKEKLLTVLELYKRRGFHVRTILADGEFSPLATELPHVAFNLCGADEHVPEIERYIRTIKDRTRSCYNALPFKAIPRLMLARMVANAVFWLNALPPRDGVSPTLSPRYLLTGYHLDYRRHARIPLGAYAQVHEEHANDLRPRTAGAICLGPTGNIQGTHFFLSLSTGRLLRRPHWTELPTPTDVIERVSQMGLRDGMPHALSFADRFGHGIPDDVDEVDDEHDSLYEPQADDATASSFDSLDDVADSADEASVDYSTGDDWHTPPPAGVNDNNGTNITHDRDITHDLDFDLDPDSDQDDGDDDRALDQDEGTVDQSEGHMNQDDETDRSAEGEQQAADNISTTSTDDEHEGDQPPVLGNPNASPPRLTSPRAIDNQAQVAPPEVDTLGPGTTTGVEDVLAEGPTGVGAATGVAETGDDGPAEGHELNNQPPRRRRHKYNLRRRGRRHDPTHIVGKAYADAFQFMASMGEIQSWSLLTAQMSAKKGLKLFGQSGKDAITEEMQQLHDRDVIEPVPAESMTREQKRAALHYLMFLKQKRCGRIKARGCADGRKQRLWKTKQETSAPTVRTESVLLSAAIDAHERRKTLIVDVPGAFMQADIDELIHVKFEGETARALLAIAPDIYKKHVAYERGKLVIYCMLRKALYGTLQGALLFWKNLSSFLRDELGFTINPYDECVANKVVNGTQMTILWHVDDIKISHIDEKELMKVFDKLNDKYGKEAPLTLNKGPKFDYLGMNLDYSTPGRVTIGMDDFVQRILEDSPEDMAGYAVTPAGNHLFQVNNKATKLDPAQSETFHHLVAMMLYLCKRVRPDIHTTVAFLCTRVASPDEDDYKKLCRCVKYLRAYPDLKLTLEVNPNKVLEWWVDASFTVHPDMKSHTGGMMTIGRGASYTISTKQKINTKSSTEAELVGVDDCMPTVIWARHFLKAQGFDVSDNIIYQDNQSAILLERNGRRSSGKKTRHIEIRYFFITDRIAKQHVRVEYCPTEEMNADAFTKPLQGSAFRKFRRRMLNLPDDFDPPVGSPQECVENSCPDQTPVVDPDEGVTGSDQSKKGIVEPQGEWIQVVKKDNRVRRSVRAGLINFCESQV